jgi:indolepyruvate ferredoxin oxidoreductase beta subunit
MSDLPIRIAILALGGQGGGVLTRWLVTLAESHGWIAQTTSVPGVAQRTGTTVYYIEIAPGDGPEPVMALMPASGDVDIVIAAEFMEAGRAVARGFVNPQRTTLIASSHRIYAISEKSQPGDGRMPAAAVLEAIRQSSKRLLLADFASIAERSKAPISAALFGALAGSEALPFRPDRFETAIERSGMLSPANRDAFASALATAKQARNGVVAGIADSSVQSDPADRTLTQAWAIPEPAMPVYRLGIEKIRDYQGERLVPLYRDRIDAFCKADRELGGESREYLLTATACRHLALWMTYEDVFRVADLKTRPGRFARIQADAGLPAGAIVHVTEFMHPRYEEICDSLPHRLGSFLRNSRRARRVLSPLLARGRFVRTTGLAGFGMLWLLARAGRWRTGSLRWHDEQQRIEAWLESALNAARDDYDLAVEILRLQRLVKGYGDTHARGLAKFRICIEAADHLRGTPGAARRLAGLRDAALADEEGAKLQAALADLRADASEIASDWPTSFGYLPAPGRLSAG